MPSDSHISLMRLLVAKKSRKLSRQHHMHLPGRLHISWWQGHMRIWDRDHNWATSPDHLRWLFSLDVSATLSKSCPCAWLPAGKAEQLLKHFSSALPTVITAWWLTPKYAYNLLSHCCWKALPNTTVQHNQIKYHLSPSSPPAPAQASLWAEETPALQNGALSETQQGADKSCTN